MNQIFYHYLNFFNEEYKQHYKECKSLNTPHKGNPNFVKICGNIVTHLKTNYEELNKSDLEDHHCNLLSLWTYEQLHTNYKYAFDRLVPIYGGIEGILSEVFIYPKESKAIGCLCNVSVFSPIKKWKESKDLYDYCVDYDEIIKKSPSSYDECKTYEKYLKDISLLYEKFNELYISKYKENKDFYEKCERCNPKSVLLGLDCDKLLLAPKKAEAGQHGPGSLAPTPSSRQNSGSTDTYGNVLLEVVATSMTSGMIFKFTPLGRRFRNGLGWNNYSASNLNDEGNMLFAQTHDPFSPHSEEREHHIGYLPA
ncbi:VIR protein [Plasmodium vivax]|uniref:VIR protein n=1 Tax=Plasmodium vivax TaxID=5855 RepID=A0A1G4E511_PLAVI|nr:VIR protein [Plasmodium vivax]